MTALPGGSDGEPPAEGKGGRYPRLTVDPETGASYVAFNSNPVVRTFYASADIFVDGDVNGAAVGVEKLDSPPLTVDEARGWVAIASRAR